MLDDLRQNWPLTSIFSKNWCSRFYVGWPTTKLAFALPIFKNLSEKILCWLTYDKMGLYSPYFQKFDGVDSMLTDLLQNWPLLSLFSKNWRSRFYVDWPTKKLDFALSIFKNLTEYILEKQLSEINS